jgi:hypothetical protein
MREFGSCGKRQASEDDADPVLAGAAAHSALEPRFVLMDPVAVYTGRADLPGGAARPAAKVPMPRLRPALPGSSAALEASRPMHLVR